ncbi:MAG: TIR domain-containing protein [Bacteroidales bacterium]
MGSETANRPWAYYEIRKAWNDGKGVLGIYIHNLECPRNGKYRQGANPFDNIYFTNGKTKLSSVEKTYNSNSFDAYNDIANNLEDWIEAAISAR